jgi:diguanylate cyclase
VASARLGRSGWIVGRYSGEGLERLLTGDSLPGVGRGYLLDAEGRVLFGGVPDLDRAPLPLADLLASEDGSAPYQTDSGAPRIGAARRLGHLGWHVAMVAHLDEGFEPIEPLLLQIFLLDVALVLIMVWITYRVTAGLVRPVASLCQGARRIAQGDLDVDVPETRTDDEIGTLTRTFNAMTHKLREDQAEIGAAHRQLREQNQALQAANEVLAQLSITDGLTKLHNHRFFQDHLTRELKRANRSGEPLSILLIDIDDFKALNDQHGHAAGDVVLERIGQVMNTAIRESDLLARYGGEEFVVLAATDLEGAVNLAEKLRVQIGNTAIPIDDEAIVFVTVSVGVSRYKGDRKAFFRDADRALYAAKAAGKNCVVVDAQPF